MDSLNQFLTNAQNQLTRLEETRQTLESELSYLQHQITECYAAIGVCLALLSGNNH